jgi:hypothetical protein
MDNAGGPGSAGILADAEPGRDSRVLLAALA